MLPRIVLVLVQSLLIGLIANNPLSAQDLRQADISAHPWSAIGKLNNSVGGSCTAAMIGQNKVLTAAHCIFNRRRGRFVRPDSIHLLFGYQRGDYKLHASVSDFTVGPGYDPASNLTPLRSDWVVLTLADPLPPEMKPLRLSDVIPPIDVQLMTGGYAGRPLHIMTTDERCRLLRVQPGSALLTNNCRLRQGGSGAPLLIKRGEDFFIVGVQVAIGRSNGSDVMIAVSTANIKEQLSKSSQ